MHDPNRGLKWLLVVGLVVLAIVVLYPPNRKLKGGIDLVGGTSLLYEIDTSGLNRNETFELSTRIMRILKERVDPQSQLNIEWRPVGNTRLEIRMPRPPQATIARRMEKEAALDRLEAMNVSRFEVEEALNAPADQRPQKLENLIRSVPERKTLFEELVKAYDAQRSAEESGVSDAVESARDAYEKAISDLLATSLPILRLTDVLALTKGQRREEELARIRNQYPAYDVSAAPNTLGPLSAAVTAYDAWASEKSDLEDPSDLKRRLKGAGVLEFRVLADRDPENPSFTKHSQPTLRLSIDEYVDQLSKFGPRPKAGDRYQWFPIEDVVKFLHLTTVSDFEKIKNDPGRPIMEEYAGRYYVLAHKDEDFGLLRASGERKWALKRARGDRNPLSGENVVNFTLDARGGTLFRKLTGANVKRQLCIMLDNMASSHATINEAIGEHGQISGRFTVENVVELVNTLEAGSLPARLKETPLAEQTVGPSLGQTNREKGIKAAVWGSIAVVAFMLIYYGLAGGGVANLALVLNTLFTLAVMALMQATFTLPGIAGMILTVGMAVDANVLIFERIREERARGVVLKKALNNGYDKAFSAILDGNLTTLITCLILVFVGSEEVKGFGITLGIGLATSMFTALTVTRLIFNTLIAQGWLSGLSMRRLIGVPNIDWVGLRRYFWPISSLAVTAGVAFFIAMSMESRERIYDIEFLGGTSVQVDLRPEFPLTDEQVTSYVTEEGRRGSPSAVDWLAAAANELDAAAARASEGDRPGEFKLASSRLSGEALALMVRRPLEDKVERAGIRVSGPEAILESKPGALTVDSLRAAVNRAAADVRQAADRLRRGRVQTVAELGATEGSGRSYEIVTIETNRELVQAAILAVLGDKLAVQRSVRFTAARDDEVTREAFFVIEADDHYLSDVIKTDANFDVRAFRGGVAVDVQLADDEEPVTKTELERRLREIGLQPEFEQFRTREVGVFPLGEAIVRPDKQTGYRRFAVCGVDESLHYDDDPDQWTDVLAESQLAQVQAALGRERSLSKVVNFEPQIAAQTKNRAVFALFLSFIAIAAYVWIRFGTKDYGLAVLVTLVHDVAITIGALALSNVIFNTLPAKALLVEDFKVDLPYIAAILTIIGYSLNDTIVVFDRIRENKGRAGVLSAPMINTSINQTMSRTLLTSLTVFMVVLTLYVFGGAGIHGFSYALIIGVLSGTYSTVAIAVPLVYRPVVLRSVVWIIVGLGLIGMVFAIVPHPMWRWLLSGVAALGCAIALAVTTGALSPTSPRPATA
jgi:SecD/SecF fusion protein